MVKLNLINGTIAVSFNESMLGTEITRPSTVKIKVGVHKDNSPRYEVRHWRDLKLCHLPPDAPEAQRPKLGRPPKSTSSTEAQPTTDAVTPQTPAPVESRQTGITTETVKTTDDENKQNKPAATTTNSNVGGKPTRSTRNPNPRYIDSVTTLQSNHPERMWSASVADLAVINQSIGYAK